MTPYRFASLTSAVADRESPLRQYLDRAFPHTRALQTDYRTRCGPLLVPGGTSDPATIGTAFDVMLRFALDPSHEPALATLAFGGHPQELAVVTEVGRVARAAAAGDDLVGLARASWALALCVAVYRQGLQPDSAVTALLERVQFTAPILLSLASRDAIRQLHELHAVAQSHLIPAIRPVGRLELGPTFEASALCPADADLIADGTLIDLKTRLGVVPAGSTARRDRLRVTDIYQVLAYTLFDRSDAHRIDALGIYSARYGLLVTWPLADMLATLAGQPVDLQAAREHVWRLLGG